MTSYEVRQRLELAEWNASVCFDYARGKQEEAEVATKTDSGAHTTFVTNVDREVESMCVQSIRGAFPDDEIVGEEGTGHEIRERRFTWVIDPIDGTKSYTRGLPHWAVSIAVLAGGQTAAAAIAVSNGVYAATRGDGGVKRNGVPFARRARTSGKNLCLALESFEWLPKGAELWWQLTKIVGSPWAFGSAVATCALVLDGALDAYLHPGLALWDHAAVALLLKEAGLRLCRWDGSDPFPGIWDRVRSDPKNYLDRVYRFDLLAATSEAAKKLLPFLAPHAGWMER
ncbi:inositol monophosphatase [Patescibacteria group bacterium]|nr:MAG: inositol monophosphatase [Patescibacteria group bacterium]